MVTIQSVIVPSMTSGHSFCVFWGPLGGIIIIISILIGGCGCEGRFILGLNRLKFGLLFIYRQLTLAFNDTVAYVQVAAAQVGAAPVERGSPRDTVARLVWVNVLPGDLPITLDGLLIGAQSGAVSATVLGRWVVAEPPPGLDPIGLALALGRAWAVLGPFRVSSVDWVRARKSVAWFPLNRVRLRVAAGSESSQGVYAIPHPGPRSAPTTLGA